MPEIVGVKFISRFNRQLSLNIFLWYRLQQIVFFKRRFSRSHIKVQHVYSTTLSNLHYLSRIYVFYPLIWGLLHYITKNSQVCKIELFGLDVKWSQIEKIWFYLQIILAQPYARLQIGGNYFLLLHSDLKNQVIRVW